MTKQRPRSCLFATAKFDGQGVSQGISRPSLRRLERMRIDVEGKVLVYTEDNAPFYAGEMFTNWILPGIRRELTDAGKGCSNIRQGIGACGMPGAVHRFQEEASF